MCQFTCTDQKASDNSEVYRSVHSIELASCNLFDAHNLEVPVTFFENLWNPALKCKVLYMCTTQLDVIGHPYFVQSVCLYFYMIIVMNAGVCEYGDELSCSIKCGEFLD